MNPIINTFKKTANQISSDRLDLLDNLYTPEIQFRDSFHEIDGLPNLREYFRRLYENVELCEFEFIDEFEGSGSAVLIWLMKLRHRTFRRGEELLLDGSTHLKFNQKIFYHRDYFDAGAMIYERVPVLGSVIRSIKKRL